MELETKCPVRLGSVCNGSAGYRPFIGIPCVRCPTGENYRICRLSVNRAAYSEREVDNKRIVIFNIIRYYLILIRKRKGYCL